METSNENIKKAILVGVSNVQDEHFNYEMNELVGLAEACGIKTVKTIVQFMPHPNLSTYVGSGKILEVTDEARQEEADYIIFNDELSPATLSNIADVVESEIMDRTMLILKIFELRAQTKEAKLQVELANLNYMLPRLIGAHKNLSRSGGGGGGGGGARRGSGETALELDRRHVLAKINKIKSDLDDITFNRKATRVLRKKNNTPVVAFVGYTNAGKSSTINAVINYVNKDSSKEVFVKDMLFATLETSSRGIKLDNNHEFLITDTVGFVQKLPHHLVESFKSTLEEINEASLIIHLIDSSSPYLDYQVETTKEVLKSLGCENIPVLYAYNKVDQIKNEILFSMNYEPNIKISAINSLGIKELIDYIDKALYPSDHHVTLLIPYTKGSIVNNLQENAKVINCEYLNEGTKLEVSLSEYLYNLYQEYILSE